MKSFLELNHYLFRSDNFSDILKKVNANIGYLFFLPKHFIKITSIFHGLNNEVTSIKGVDFLLLKAKYFNPLNNLIKRHREIKSLNPHYILIHGLRYGVYSFFLKKILPNSIVIVQAHGFAKSPKKIKKFFYKWMSLFVDGFIFTGHNNAKDWIEENILSKEKVFEVMEGSTNFCFDQKIIKHSESFLWVGRLDKNKDPITIINAFEEYLTFKPEAKLSMVYNSDELVLEVMTRINTSKILKKNILLIGELEHDSLQKLYMQSQFFILGSHYEGSGYALLESMACGCIPIVTKIPSFQFMTDNGSCALLFESGNRKELLHKLKETNEINIKNYQKKVLDQFQNRLSFEAIASDIFNAFQELSKRKDYK